MNLSLSLVVPILALVLGGGCVLGSTIRSELPSGTGTGTSGTGCDPRQLTMYKVLVETAWSPDVFPKQYPEWRPPAQWSKVLGRSHDSGYAVFHVGEVASDGLKEFSEVGKSDILDSVSQGDAHILDEFTAPPITEGAGTTNAQFFVDGNHSRVSLVSRVVPSPDWFIGVDSFNLCVEGKWIESVVLEVDPLDAGTDNGFTFTSPNWPTIPRKAISRITALSPDHPANSFYYPDRTQHPPIATFYIVKVREYNLGQEFTPSLTSKTSAVKTYSPDDLLIPTSTTRRQRPRVNNDNNNNSSSNNNEEVSNDIIPPDSQTTTTISTTSNNGKEALLNTIVNKYKKKFRKNRRGRKMGRRRNRAPRDCRVSEWSEWSSCSKTCGIGEQIRTRTVLRHARRGGRPCPTLQETKWCGSSRDCEHKYFDW